MVSVADFPRLNQVKRGSVEWFDVCIERGKKEPFAEIVELTPKLANAILVNNPENRNISEKRISHYASAMRRGLWALNGETIIIAKTGQCNDGQHRALGLIAANVTVPVTIFFGAERETRTTIDLGGARSAGNLLAMSGKSNVATLGAASRYVLAFESSNGKSLGNANGFVAHEQFSRSNNDIELALVAKYTDTHKRVICRYAKPGAFAAAYYFLRSVDETVADNFITDIVRGEGLHINDPAYTVRETLLRSKRLTGQEQIEVILRGWVALRQNRKPRAIKIEKSLPALF